MSKLKTVINQQGGDDYSTIAERCAEVTKATSQAGLVNPFSYYLELLEDLGGIGDWVNVTMAEIGAGDPPLEKRFALRHDVDAQPIAAIQASRALSERGLKGSFYLLHTSHYYGKFHDQDGQLMFVRHRGLENIVSELIRTGQDIGIHNDALGIVFDHGGNGAQCLNDEIIYLRSLGIDVTGSAAHNSTAVYGAECFEIFRGLSVGNREIIHWRGKSADLQIVEMDDLGLRYEANHPIPRPQLDLQGVIDISRKMEDPLRNPDWQRRYFVTHPVFERGYDFDAWLVGVDQWILSGKGECHFPLKKSELVEAMKAIDEPVSIVFSIHPIYVSGATSS